MPEGLKIMTKTGTILYDSSSVAGVDYAANVTNYYAPLQDDNDD
jgi:hypothetical protein